MRTEGTKYDGFRSVVEIAKDIRRDIKTDLVLGELPDLKVSVKSRYYAGGQSIDIRWSATHGTHKIGCNYHASDDCGVLTDHPKYANFGRYSKHGEMIQHRLRAIADTYNYDNSDVQSDYFDTLFYCHPQWDYSVKLKGSNLVGFDPRTAETLVTLYHDGTPVALALEIAEKLEKVS